MDSKVAAITALAFAAVCATALGVIGFSLLSGSAWLAEVVETIPGRVALLLVALAIGLLGGVLVYFFLRPPTTKRLILSIIPIFLAAAFGGGFFPRGIAYTENETGMMISLLTQNTSTVLSVTLAIATIFLVIVYAVVEIADRYIFDR